MKVAVYGVGGVGGYFGGRLALGGADVHLVARGPHLSALRERGLGVSSVLGDFETSLPATDDLGDIGPCDYVLFCVKSFDTESIATHLQPLLGEDTGVISLQNGVENEERLAAQIGWQHVLGGAAFIFSSISEPGAISHTGGPARIVLGEMDGSRSERAVSLWELCVGLLRRVRAATTPPSRSRGWCSTMRGRLYASTRALTRCTSSSTYRPSRSGGVTGRRCCDPAG